ncbi:MAG: hypothetical protein G8D61_00610 [gamma proteobacterium symbiont of Ctena orbiculata]|nr:hypothetical protein [Candidatus Thiodiazotropha taylori]MBT3057531.1 hypothetical protein [Candidatus Thiodiazotropha sp. (ex Lucina pensylvanica)]MBT3062653.1 hypothetical protein [Candidatus Thiodiazotropha sp. (ex Lucina pensylvanica)]MBV2096365.1 hypothetical protein [Candidatus Thiodiazotropha sp. (ex Codakia orbicularis)]PUB76341.1 MAG: hypothetical protein DBP03_05105 [gamma proteobacterium symbiont of Ctena orbiculata]
MKIEQNIPLLEELLAEWKSTIGVEYLGYRNHVYRMVNFCLALTTCSEEEREKIIIAGAFHDIGIWIDDTVDYIPPSLPPAVDYLTKRGCESWADEIKLMIEEHHRIRAYSNDKYPLVEIFRQGDLVDFSYGLFRFGIPSEYIDEVKALFPNAGFHASLARRAGKWFLKHPLNPLPMMKW